MQVRLLGAVELIDDNGTTVPLTSNKVRALLTVLALSPGRVVSTDRLIDELWGDDAPVGVANALQVLVSKLRRALNGTEVTRRSSGYVLELDPEQVDVVRFERAVGAGREAIAAGDLEAGVAILTAGEAQWRGDALSDFGYDAFAQPHIARLAELRLAALEDRIDAELTLGQHQSLVGDLDGLVASYPLRERLRGQLMLALYRAGRQADALRTFQDARRLLGEELGLDPGPELRRLEAAVLAQDPALDGRMPVGAARSPRARTNLRAPLTALIGRVAERAELIDALAEHRLVTLVGPGGAGKTRLAVAAAEACGDELADGAWIVELAAIGDPDDVATAIATTLGVPEAVGAGSDERATRLRVVEFLAGKELLLVLDNCEHVISAAAQVTEELLGRCPALTILATSREALRLPGEVVRPLPPLPLDEAVALFTERARAADPTFAVDTDDPTVVAEICQRLDGMPLAIELAAARRRAFPVQQILERLDDRFRLLTGGARTALPRQQTLRAVVDWSYELLFEDERRMFERLSVFADGCTLAAAEAVGGADPIEPADVAGLVAALVDKSLIVVDGAGEPRVRQLQTLAHYGRERLAESGDAEATRSRMLAHFVEVSGDGRRALAGHDQAGWLKTVRTELDNLRAALSWAVAASDHQGALCIAGALGWFWWLNGQAGEGCRWLDVALADADEQPTAARADVLLWRAHLGYLAGEGGADPRAKEALSILADLGEDVALALGCGLMASQAAARGELDECRALLADALDAYSRLPDSAWTRGARAFLGSQMAEVSGDWAGSEALLRQSIEHLDGTADLWGMSLVTMTLASHRELAGDYTEAGTLLARALQLCQALGLDGLEATLLSRLGNLAMFQGDLELAERLQSDALDRGRRLVSPPIVARALNGMAIRLRRQGRIAAAEAAADEALEIYRARNEAGTFVGRDRGQRYDVPAGAAISLRTLGHLAGDRGDRSGSTRLHEAALREAARSGDMLAIVPSIIGLAGAAAHEGDGRRAASLLGQLGRLQGRLELGTAERREVEQAESMAAALLGTDRFLVSFEQGKAAGLEELLPEP